MSPIPLRQWEVPGAREAHEYFQSLGSEGAPTPLAPRSTEAATPLASPSTEGSTRLALPSIEAPTPAALPSMGPPGRLALLSTEQQAGPGELADLHREAADEQELGSEEGDDEDEDEQEDEPTIKNEDEEGVAGVPRFRKHAEFSEAERTARNRANKVRAKARKAAKKAKEEEDAEEKKPRTDKAGRVSKPGKGQNQRQSGSQPTRGQPTSGSGFASGSSGSRVDRGRANSGRGDRGRGRGGRDGYSNRAPRELFCRTCGGGNAVSILIGTAPALVAAFPLLCFICNKRRDDAPEAPAWQRMPTLPTPTTTTPATVAPIFTAPAPVTPTAVATPLNIYPSLAAPSVPAVNAFEAAMLRQEQLDAEADARRWELLAQHQRRRREMNEAIARAEQGGNLAAYYETRPPPESVYGRPLGSRRPDIEHHWESQQPPQPSQPQGRRTQGALARDAAWVASLNIPPNFLRRSPTPGHVEDEELE